MYDQIVINRMKKSPFPLITVLLIIASCFPSCNNNSKKVNTETATVLPADSLFEPTGNAQLDSLLQLAAVAPQDTNLAMLYHRIALTFVYNDIEKSKAYYLKLRNLSEQLNWDDGLFRFASGFSGLLQREGLIDSSLILKQHYLELAKENKNERWCAI